MERQIEIANWYAENVIAALKHKEIDKQSAVTIDEIITKSHFGEQKAVVSMRKIEAEYEDKFFDLLAELKQKMPGDYDPDFEKRVIAYIPEPTFCSQPSGTHCKQERA